MTSTPRALDGLVRMHLQSAPHPPPPPPPGKKAPGSQEQLLQKTQDFGVGRELRGRGFGEVRNSPGLDLTFIVSVSRTAHQRFTSEEAEAQRAWGFAWDHKAAAPKHPAVTSVQAGASDREQGCVLKDDSASQRASPPIPTSEPVSLTWASFLVFLPKVWHLLNYSPHNLGSAAVRDDMNSYVSQYYNGPSSDSGAPEPAVCVVTTAAVDIHRPDLSSDLCLVDVALKPSSSGTCASATSESASRSTCSSVTRAQSDSSQTLGSSTDCSTGRKEPSSEPGPSPRPLLPPPQQQMAEAAVQDLLSSLSEDPCPSQGALDPAPLTWPSPTGSAQSSPELEPRVSLFNQKNQEGFTVFQIKPVIHFQPAAPMLEEKFRSLESKEQKLHRVPEA
ncbi:hypothetical protein GH733_004546 [Mirounga leonina]|nr:hypothetical protein GH733_004546 [Mirounga leonina]